MRAAVIEAAHIVVALHRHANGDAPLETPPPAPQEELDDLDAEIGWLTQVAEAVNSSSTIDAFRPQNDRWRHHHMPTRTTVVIDQDGGIDDALALILLARTPGIEIAGIGSVHGNVTAKAAASNGLRALELAGNHTTPVAVGAAEPFAQSLHLAHPADLLGKLAGAPKRAPAPEEAAAEQLVRLAHKHAGEIDLLTLGPLTNIALALRAEPDLPRLLRRVVSMAGAVTVKGNISEYAESNVWHDPEAAAEVMTAGFDLTLVPLDVTRKATVSRLWLERLATDQDQLWGRVAAMLLAAPGKLPAFPLHDPLTAAILLDPTIATYRHSPITVDLTDHHRGQTCATETDLAPPVAVVTGADTSTLLNQLLRRCSPKNRGERL